MRRLLGVLAAGAMVLSTFAVGSFAPTTHATEVWCMDDPVVTINGVTVSINVGVSSSAAGHITGTIPLVIVVPNGATTQGARLYAANFSNSGVQIHALIDVRFVDRSDANRYTADGLTVTGQQGGSANQITVLSQVPGNTSFGTRLSSPQSPKTDVSTSNNVMSIGIK
jgi:hypothetical protein